MSLLVQFNEEHAMLMKNKEVEAEIIQLINEASELVKFDHVGLIQYLGSSSFFQDPASASHHLNVVGGLARHTLSVYRETAKILDSQPEWASGSDTLSNAYIILACIAHDFCKIGSYQIEKAWRKDDYGKWEEYERYNNKKLDFNPGHGVGSLLILNKFYKVPEQVAEAILHHMGSFDGGNFTATDKARQASFSYNPLAVALHLGDMASSWMLESKVTKEMLEEIEKCD